MLYNKRGQEEKILLTTPFPAGFLTSAFIVGCGVVKGIFLLRGGIMSKVRDGNFITIPSFMVKDLKLKGSELLIYAIIYGFTQAENQRYTGSLQYLADWTNTTKQSVINNLKSLIAKGLVVKKEAFKNNIKFYEYYSKNLNEVLKKVEYPIKKSLPNNIDNTIVDNNNSINSLFDEVWEQYPRKQGKKEARAAFERVIKKGVDFKAIKDGVYRYSEYVKGYRIDTKYIKQGSTFFRGECWNDEFVPNKKQEKASYNLEDLEIIE